jgi:hypothetical protein
VAWFIISAIGRVRMRSASHPLIPAGVDVQQVQFPGIVETTEPLDVVILHSLQYRGQLTVFQRPPGGTAQIWRVAIFREFPQLLPLPHLNANNRAPVNLSRLAAWRTYPVSRGEAAFESPFQKTKESIRQVGV